MRTSLVLLLGNIYMTVSDGDVINTIKFSLSDNSVSHHHVDISQPWSVSAPSLQGLSSASSIISSDPS